MGSTVKASPSSGNTPRPKKASKSLIVKLKLSSKSLANFEPVAIVKTEPESKAASSTTSNTLAAAISSPGENESESNPNTPAPSGTEDLTAMPPPIAALKKETKGGVKRKSEQTDGLVKPRGKPGPKKKTKLEEGVVENVAANNKGPAAVGAAAAHKLGPKANQGAINAGLRALDRSGKPCRKWQKSGFQLKTFTGTTWEIKRWCAPPKVKSNGESAETTSESSTKENKESQVGSEKSNSAGDIEMGSMGGINASSPAPAVTASA